jgi:tyrosine decarboxylase/aspartate 1-decarboxylase
MFDKNNLKLLDDALHKLDMGFNHLPLFDPKSDSTRMSDILDEVAERMKDNFPYPHPMYAGQMLKPPDQVALLAYALAMWINPNNHALDGGRASSLMEKESVSQIAGMFGWSQHLGHLCSGGTIANMEALWISRCLNPDKKIVASSQAHYTHKRISEVLKINFEEIPCDSKAKINTEILESMLKKGDIGTVVASLGTTGTGSVDQIDEICRLREKYDFRIHVDAAYGGYFQLVDNLDSDTRSAFNCLNHVDSIVVDPHKHGLQPYGCGCVLFRDTSVGSFYKHDSPYTYFTSNELHLGEISLECSRAGASAVALWATLRMFPLVKSGEFALNLTACRNAAIELYRRLCLDGRFLTLFPPELDIIIFAPKAPSLSEISRQSKLFFDLAAENNLHLALVNMPIELIKPYWNDVEFDRKTVMCLRSCLMKPEHNDWIDAIWHVLVKVSEEM